MTKERLTEIMSQFREEREFAERIMSGEADGYDGADGARTVITLSKLAQELEEEAWKYLDLND
jgi:hypothetical protein